MSLNLLHKILIKWIISAVILSFSSLAQANQCAITHTDKHSHWPFLDTSCPIGIGLWSKKPDSITSQFWVQIAYGSHEPNHHISELIHQYYPKQSFLLKDADHYRALIGRFNSFVQAQQAKKQLAKIGITESFIRQVHLAKPVKKTKVVEKAPKIIPSYHSSTSPKTSSHKSPSSAAQKIMTYDDIDNTFVTNMINLGFEFSHLRFFTPQNLPVNAQNTSPFIMENNHFWIGTTWKQASQWCEHFGLTLPTPHQLSLLAKQGQEHLRQHKWPNKFNYWTSNKVNARTYSSVNIKTGKVQNSSLNTKLYATCVTD